MRRLDEGICAALVPPGAGASHRFPCSIAKTGFKFLFGVMLGSLSQYFRVCFVICLGEPGIVLGFRLFHFGASLESCWERFCCNFGGVFFLTRFYVHESSFFKSVDVFCGSFIVGGHLGNSGFTSMGVYDGKERPAAFIETSARFLVGFLSSEDFHHIPIQFHFVATSS